MGEAVYAFHAQPSPLKMREGATSAYFVGVFLKVKKDILERPGFNSPGRVPFGGSLLRRTGARPRVPMDESDDTSERSTKRSRENNAGGNIRGGVGGGATAGGGGDAGGGINSSASFDSRFLSTTSYISE
jgi:hypothetical protein